jgi:hypothetical protein
VFTGGGLTFDAGNAVPGLSMRVHGGYAWSEKDWRGGAEVAQRFGGWEAIARAERQLAHTNDFTWALDPEPAVPPMLSGDLYDYLDRRLGGVVVRSTASEGVGFRFEAARASDRNVGRNVMEFPAPDSLGAIIPPETHVGNTRLIRPVFPGNYWLGRAEMRVNPSAGGISLHPGLALRLAAEAATGDLDWRASRPASRSGACSAAGPSRCAATPAPCSATSRRRRRSSSWAPSNDLPGFDYKQFVGDRAAIGRATLMYTLPIFNAPIRLGSMWLPAPAPSPSVGIQTGWTDAAAPETQALMDSFGWTTSNGARSDHRPAHALLRRQCQRRRRATTGIRRPLAVRLGTGPPGSSSARG